MSGKTKAQLIAENAALTAALAQVVPQYPYEEIALQHNYHGLCAKAMREGLVLVGTYHKPDQEPRQRQIVPVTVYKAGGQWYTRAWVRLLDREGKTVRMQNGKPKYAMHTFALARFSDLHSLRNLTQADLEAVPGLAGTVSVRKAVLQEV